MTTCLGRICAISCVMLVATASLAGLNDGLVLHYPFDVNHGAAVVDQSPYGNDGIVNGATWIADGVVNGAMRFNGIDNYLRVPRSVSLEPTQITVAVWVRVASFDPTYQTVVFKKNPRVNNHEGYEVKTIQGGRFDFQVTSCGGAQGGTPSGALATSGTWYHVVGTFAEPTAKLYVNGHLEEQINHPYPICHDTTRDVLIGCNDHATFPLQRFYVGDVDDVRIYNRALSLEEVLALYEEAVPPGGSWIERIGFSDDPEGDQDVTVFARNETLYVRVEDVDLNPRAQVKIKLQGRGLNARGVVTTLVIQQNLVPQADGSFKVAIPLNRFLPGTIKVDLDGKIPGSGFYKLLRSSKITILP